MDMTYSAMQCAVKAISSQRQMVTALVDWKCAIDQLQAGGFHHWRSDSSIIPSMNGWLCNTKLKCTSSILAMALRCRAFPLDQ